MYLFRFDWIFDSTRGVISLLGCLTKERGNHRIRVYFSFIQHKNPQTLCNPDVTSFSQGGIGNNFNP